MLMPELITTCDSVRSRLNAHRTNELTVPGRPDLTALLTPKHNGDNLSVLPADTTKRANKRAWEFRPAPKRARNFKALLTAAEKVTLAERTKAPRLPLSIRPREEFRPAPRDPRPVLGMDPTPQYETAVGPILDQCVGHYRCQRLMSGESSPDLDGATLTFVWAAELARREARKASLAGTFNRYATRLLAATEGDCDEAEQNVFGGTPERWEVVRAAATSGLLMLGQTVPEAPEQPAVKRGKAGRKAKTASPPRKKTAHPETIAAITAAPSLPCATETPAPSAPCATETPTPLVRRSGRQVKVSARAQEALAQAAASTPRSRKRARRTEMPPRPCLRGSVRRR
ncbi:hypothetical protein LTR53_017727, partial [Teratosphaeriaceae sp. CCFEE 6253]